MSMRIAVLGVVSSVAAISLGFAATRADDAVPPAAPAAVPAVEPVTKKTVQLDPALATLLHRVGLQAERLAIAGVSDRAATQAVDAVRSWLAEHPALLTDADVRLSKAIANRDRLFRRVRSGLASKEEVAACAESQKEYLSADADRTAILQQAFAAGTDGVPKDTRDLLALAEKNFARWKLPVEYLVVEREDADWVRLRNALANERQPVTEDDPPDPDELAFLADVRANVTVADARVRLDTNLGAVKEAWNAAAARVE